MGIKLFWVIAVIILSCIPERGATVFSVIHDLVQDNIAGTPVIHEKTDWDFDPDAGKIRRIQFEALNGWQGRNLIDRLGYGIAANGVTPKTSRANIPKVILPTTSSTAL